MLRQISVFKSIVNWNDQAIDKCKGSLNCKKWQDKEAEKLKMKLKTIKLFQGRISLKLKRLPRDIGNIEDLLLQSVKCSR